MVQPPAAAAAPRRLLKRLRDLMAAGGSGQERLDRIVRIIAADMVAEVCSVYVMRAGQVLELFATQGLKPEAVHRTRLSVGEGLVGDIAAFARPLALADAQSHPNFAYRPETGEEIFHSLLGVPVLRGGRVLGVLVVQNRTHRDYTEEETETLLTVAMVLAELIAGGGLIGTEEAQRAGAATPAPARIEGIRLTDGIAIGRAVLHEPRVAVRQMVADNPETELGRLETALVDLRSALDTLLARPEMAGDGEHREVLETYRMFAEDRGWLGRIAEAIRSGLTAEAAVQKSLEDTRARMAHITDPYLRERLADLEDLAHRLLRHLAGESLIAAARDLPDDAIVFARNMGPAELLDYDRKRLRGVVLEEGSATAHVAIVARALDIPMVGRAKDVLDQIEPMDPVVVDADTATVLVRPGEDVRELFQNALRVRAERRATYAALRDLPAMTRDGVAISLNLNAGLLVDVEQLEPTGADGIGLFRTEVLFMTRPSFPDVRNQVDLYRRVLDRAAGRPVTFRTLDVGGDKVLPYFDGPADENPAMGWRALRIALDRPLMLRHQLRAILLAAAGREVDVMFPMVAEVAEFDAARALLDRELERAERRGRELPRRVRVGAMLEVPALYWQLSALLPRVDFLSVGSNDLLQFFFASDRGNPRLADRYDPLSPAVLSFLHELAGQCDRAGVPLTLCGEMGGRSIEALALIGAGFRRLSMGAPSIGPVKAMIRSVDLAPLSRFIDEIRRGADHSLRERLRAYASDHAIVL